MPRANKDMLLPAFIGTAVALIALTLLAIVARSPWTHSNLDPAFDPRYRRTEQMVLGAPMPMGRAALAVTPASDPAQLGKQLFVVDGCAGCHGLDGRGGVIGPSLIGTKQQKLRTMTSVGPQGMPAYAPGALSDEDLAAIAAFLNSAGK